MQVTRRGPRSATVSTLAAAAVALLAGLGLVLLGAPSASAAGNGPVYVVQGIPGVTADVLVDGDVVGSAAATKTVVGPVSLAQGRHTVSLRSGSDTVAEASFDVVAGSGLDLVAHLQADAKADPVITVFANDASSVAPGKARLVISHAAAVPAVDLVVDGQALAKNVANGESYTALVPARTFSVSAVPSATGGAAIIGPLDVAVEAATLTRVFVIGDIAKSLDVVVQTWPVPVSGASAPNSVQTGDGGQAAAGLLDDPAALGALGAGALALALATTVGYSRRSRRTVPGRALR